jgi:hypothetical protein
MAVVRPFVVTAVLLLAAGSAHAGSPYSYEDEVPAVQREHIWLPFGLLDRMRLAPFHMSAITEMGTHDAGDGTASVTVHAQMSTECSCNVGIYGTLASSIALTNESRASQPLATGGSLSPVPRDPRTQLGTLDVGLFGGTKNRRSSWIYRVGTLLPTGTRHPHPWLPSARVGDRVLELPRSTGVRVSTSKIYGWRTMPRLCDDLFTAFRIDAGLDIAAVLALPGNPVHVIPRGGAGAMMSRGGNFIYTADTAVSVDPFVDDGLNLRWSAGVTARYARADGRNSVVQPALTLATTRTSDGWSASLLLDLTASLSLHESYD